MVQDFKWFVNVYMKEEKIGEIAGIVIIFRWDEAEKINYD